MSKSKIERQRENLQPSVFLDWRLILCAAVIGSIYIFNVTTPFDFIDDGAISHDQALTSFADWWRVLVNSVVSDYVNRGPFRPTAAAFTLVEATLLGPHPVLWRAVWVIWCIFTSYLSILLMSELRIPLYPAAAATAFAVWNSRRIEIWTNLASPEAMAMPFALFALFAAARAARSSRPLVLDLLGFFAILAALGCKNTFAALIPAQAFLRVVRNDESIREGIYRRWKFGLLLSLSTAWPIIHLLHFRANWHPGQYSVPGPTMDGLRRVFEGWQRGALTLMTVPALFLAAAAIARNEPHRSFSDLYRLYRNALIAALLLGSAGLIVYLPMGSSAGGPGRYTIPAILGLDLLLGATFAAMLRLQDTKLKRAAVAALLLGLVAAAVYNLALQDRFAARTNVIARLLEEIYANAPVGSAVVWNGREGSFPDLGEGIHLQWHLQQRGRSDLHFQFIKDGQKSSTSGSGQDNPSFVVGLPSDVAGNGVWLPHTLRQRYWFGFRDFEISYLEKAPRQPS